jgi:hypothetical protein
MTANKKLGLLLLPLVPLSAMGIVSIVNRALPSAPPVVECQPIRAVEAPRPAPEPRPAPRPAPPHTPTAD